MLPAVTATPGHTTASLPTIAASPPTVDTERAIASFTCARAYAVEGASNTRLIYPQHIWSGEHFPIQCLHHTGPGHLSAWHTITSYCEGIRFFLKSCISINCLTSLPYLCSKGTARLPKSSPLEHYFPSVCFNSQTCV